VWPDKEKFWENNAVKVNYAGLDVYNREVIPSNEQLIPDYRLRYSYSLLWDKKLETYKIKLDGSSP